MHLITLDKKRFTVEHKVNQTELKVIQEKNKITKDEFQQQVQREMYQKFLEGVHKNIQTQVTVTPEGDEIYRISGYVLSELNMMELIKECLEMDEMGNFRMLESITNAITYRDKNVK